MVRLEIPLRAVPKGRPRSGKQGHFYTPTRTREFEETCRGYYRMFYRGEPMTGRLDVTITFYKGRGDLDNLAKSCLDAAQGILFENDSQIEQLFIVRGRLPKDKFVLTVDRIGELNE